MFKRINLNHNWKYITNFNEDYINNYPNKFNIINIPYLFNQNSSSLVTCLNTFNIEKQANKRYYLYLPKVKSLYLNKEKLTISDKINSYNKIDITKYIKNASNELLLVLETNYNSLLKEIYIEECPNLYIEKCNISLIDGLVNFDLSFIYENQLDSNIKFHIYDDKGFDVEFSKVITIANNITLKQQLDLILWTIDNPLLYKLEIYLDDLLSYYTEFGLKHVSITNNGFLLNDKQIKLRGLNRHNNNKLFTKNLEYKEVEYLKNKLNINAIRNVDFIPSKYFLDRCDQLGILVYIDLPNDLDEISGIINELYNHPCIFIWGLTKSNNKETIDLIKKIDKVRPIGGKYTQSKSDIIEDVFIKDDYSYDGTNFGLISPIKVMKKSHPYIVSGSVGDKFKVNSNDSEKALVNQMLAHYKVLDASLSYPKLAGTFSNSLNDNIINDGILNENGIAKYSAFAYMSFREKPFLEVCSNLSLEEENIYISTNCDLVRFYINDEYIGNFYPDKEEYKYLEHPPICIHNILSYLIYIKEEYNQKDSIFLSELIKSKINLKEDKLSLKMNLKLQALYLKNKINKYDLIKLIEKYTNLKNNHTNVFLFEGILDEKIVSSTRMGYFTKSSVYIKVLDLELKESNTYEMTKLIVTHLDEYNNRIINSNIKVNINIDGPLEVVGPKEIYLIGGSNVFYLKTTNKSGIATIYIDSEGFETKQIEIGVSK